MTTNRYVQGTLVRMTASITDAVTKQPVDPTSVTLTVQLPSGGDVDLSSSVVKDAVGEYHADYLPTQVGFFQYEFAGTGDAQIAQLGSFFVDQGI